MNIFKRRRLNASLIIYICIFAFSAFLISAFSLNFNKDSDEQTIIYIEEAIRRASIHCYAVEGQYPQSLEYLMANYGLRFDSEKFIVDYQSIGSNIMPEIFVARSGEDGY